MAAQTKWVIRCGPTSTGTRSGLPLTSARATAVQMHLQIGVKYVIRLTTPVLRESWRERLKEGAV